MMSLLHSQRFRLLPFPARTQLEEEAKRYKFMCLALGVVAAALALKGKL